MSNTTQSNTGVVCAISHLFIAIIGGALIYGAYSALQYLASLAAGAIPFIFGGLLFVTLVWAFFMLIRVQHHMRRAPGSKISLHEGFTAVSIFVVMGFFAMACLHAFQHEPQALDAWNQGVVAAFIAAMLYKVGNFVGTLWSKGATAN